MTINGTKQTAEQILKLALGTKADYEADWRKAEKAYRENPSAATFADLHAARQALRRTTTQLP
jgi:hypothetical protein